uniref:Uncharacterized protein n=1 Tax=Lepeophtheirus salmonis TaxID=72036 RepID=A0A0K2V872_LEPSM
MAFPDLFFDHFVFFG